MMLNPLVVLALGSLAIVAGSGIILDLLRRLTAAIARRAGAQPATVRAINEGFRLLWLGVAAYGVIAFTGLASLFTILTVSGLIGLTISLALQTTLSNVLSGLLLLKDRTLRVGDEISFGGVRGRIVRIALRNTWLRTPSGEVAVVGNANLHAGPLVNITAAHRFDDEFRDEAREIADEAAPKAQPTSPASPSTAAVPPTP